MIWNEFIDKAIVSFELLMKGCAKYNSLFVNIQCTTACSLENIKLKVLSVEPYHLFQ